MINVCLAGSTGWAGSELARAIAGVADVRASPAVAQDEPVTALGDRIDSDVDPATRRSTRK